MSAHHRDAIGDDPVSKQLNELLGDLEPIFLESPFESTLILNDHPPIYFLNDAGGSWAKGSHAWLTKRHKRGKLHEPGTVAAIRFLENHAANRVKVIYDVGAAYGYFALLLKTAFPNSTIFAFESNPDTHHAFQKNVLVNKHLPDPAIRCLNMGLSDNSHLQKEVNIKGMHLKEGAEAQANKQLDIVSIDDFARLTGFFPDLIKIDVEGYQSRIMAGALQTIERAKPILLFELDEPETMRRFGTTNREVLQPLLDIGYRVYWCRAHRHSSARFFKLKTRTLSDEQERDSLAVLLPG